MKFQGNPKDWGQGGSPPPPSNRETVTLSSNPPPRRPRWTLPDLPYRKVPPKPTLGPRTLRQIQRVSRLTQKNIDQMPEAGDLLTPALELIAGFTPVGRAYLTARDVWGYFGPQKEETPAVPAHWEHNGWELVASCGEYSAFGYSAITPGTCGVSTLVPNQYGSPAEVIQNHPNTSAFTGGVPNPSPSLPTRFRNNIGWRRLPTTPSARPDLAPYWVPEVPAQPGTRTVQPVPATVTPPNPAITQPMPQPRETGRPEPLMPRFPRPLPVNPYRPSERPASTIEVLPGGVSIPPQVPHVQAPASGKELKINTNKGSPFYKAISGLYDGTTEASDFVDVISDSIEGNPCKGLAPVQKSYCIGQNWEKINVDKMVYGLIYNHFEDKAVGTFLSYGRKSPYGVQTPTTRPSRDIQVRFK